MESGDVSLKAEQRGYKISESHLEKPERIVRCTVCGLSYALCETETVTKITTDYQEMADDDYVREEEGRRQQARMILAAIERHKKRGRLLDIGCGPGFILDEAQRRGWSVDGIDPSRWAREYCQKKFGILIYQGYVNNAPFDDKSFDAIIMSDAIEHVSDPKGALKNVRRMMKNDGVLYLSTPDIDSFLSKLLRARWWGINKYHLFYFTRNTMQKMLESAGLKPIKYLSYPRIFSFHYWSGRLATYDSFLAKIPKMFTKIKWLGDRVFKVTLHDQIAVIVKKARTLELLEIDEKTSVGFHSKKKKVIVVLPAYHAEKTIERTVKDIPRDVVDEIILVDDASSDRTVEIAKNLGLTVFNHDRNRGYGANQKTCYQKALERGAEVVVMVHPDYQYDPTIIPQLIEPLLLGRAHAVFGSRMMKGGALEGGMPMWKHNANILLTALENVMLGTFLSEYHSGFRAYSSDLLRQIRFAENSDGFIFDTEIIVQILANGFKIEEVPIRTRYFEEASSIRLGPSILYGLGILRVMIGYYFHAQGWHPNKKLTPVMQTQVR